MGGVGKNDENRANFAQVCTNLKEVGGFSGGQEIVGAKIIVWEVGWGGGNSWKSSGKFSKKWSWGGGYNSGGESTGPALTSHCDEVM